MSGAHTAIIAAEKRRKARLQLQAEEAIKRDSAEDLEKWEFKIVRSATRWFHQPEGLAAVLEEESWAGWELLEILDDQCLRFKRLKTAGQTVKFLPPGYDPYRTQLGSSQDPLAAHMALSILGLIAFLSFAKYLLGSSSISGGNQDISMFAIAVTSLFLMFGFVAKRWRG